MSLIWVVARVPFGMIQLADCTYTSHANDRDMIEAIVG